MKLKYPEKRYLWLLHTAHEPIYGITSGEMDRLVYDATGDSFPSVPVVRTAEDINDFGYFLSPTGGIQYVPLEGIVTYSTSLIEPVILCLPGDSPTNPNAITPARAVTWMMLQQLNRATPICPSADHDAVRFAQTEVERLNKIAHIHCALVEGGELNGPLYFPE